MKNTRTWKHTLAAFSVIAVSAMLGVPAYAQLEGVLSGAISNNVSTVAPQNLEPAAGTQTLRRGDVLQLQRSLSASGYYNGTVDGRWGPQTRDAVLRYQQRNNLSATGRMNAETLDSLGLSIGADAALETNTQN